MKQQLSRSFRTTSFLFLIITLTVGQTWRTFGQSTKSLTSYVDPFVGTENGGNIVPGAQVPFGFVHVSPDTLNPTTAGYKSNEDILGFSQTHVSGTGGASKYGNFLTTPLVGTLSLTDLASPKSDEVAGPGYYAVR